MLRRIGAFLFLALSIAAPALALRGTVIDARSRAPIAHAEVTIVGQRGSARTGPDGRFEWALPVAPPFVVVVLLPDGLVSRPMHVTTLDKVAGMTLLVEPAAAESADVTGTAPAIDVSAGSSTSLLTAGDISIRHPTTLGEMLGTSPCCVSDGLERLRIASASTSNFRRTDRARNRVCGAGSDVGVLAN